MPEISPSRYTVHAGWDDVPHLDAKTKAEMLASTPPHLREARSKGIPSLGSGAIYPIPWEDVSVAPFKVPDFWRRVFALDVGWNRTAALWGAIDPDGVIYATAEYYRGEAEPSVHATAIKARGDWIPGVVDPASRGRSQEDGARLFDIYRDHGLRLRLADNTVHGHEGGIYRLWEMLSVGRFKFFNTLGNTAAEYRIYRRDENGRIIKKNDHLMDCARYLAMSGPKVAIARPVPTEVRPSGPADRRGGY